jgi:hypothetical protein
MAAKQDWRPLAEQMRNEHNAEQILKLTNQIAKLIDQELEQRLGEERKARVA